MEDPSSGAIAPAGGAPRDAAKSAVPPAGQPSPAGSTSGSDGRGAPGHKSKKRRKRRRGRKVFARDGVTPANGRPSVPEPAVEPSPAAIQPPVQPPPLPILVPRRTYQHDLPVFAALDLGTNNCRLLVALPSRPGQFRVIDAFSRIVRLGEGLSLTGRLSEAAMDRAIEALKICGEKLRNRRIAKARLIATEACRSASNGAHFLARVKEEAGIELEIIDRETEARLAVSGCGSLVERETEGVVLFDIGGGSSEVALIDLTSGKRTPRLANHIVSWTSLPVGVVSLAERFGGRDVTPATFGAMVAEVRRLLENFPGRGGLDHLKASPNFHLLGTSGTVTTLAGVHLNLERYDRRRVDGLWMDRENVDRMVEKLLSWDFPARVANPCIGADRADLVLAGCAILEGIRAVWPSERLRVADRGLREGILSELMGEAGVWRHGWRPNA
ncbi:MAG TPA: Ppx/GppA phosphatase family protein [Rhizobiaceae bacterium]|nr:Ppx/GppA phosphatase family protein [Rhizobiaceae bacterium]